MKQKIKIKINHLFKVGLYSIWLLSMTLGYSAHAQSTQYVLTNCGGGVCANLTASIPPGSTGINPNTLVNLNFAVSMQSNVATPPSCDPGKQIFHSVRHNVNGEPSRAEYLANGPGSSVNYDFNSLSEGTRNSYQGIFYCWTQALTDVGSQLGTLATQSQVWQTREFNLTTRNPTGAPAASVDNPSPSMGGTINISVTNIPPGGAASIFVNNSGGLAVTRSPYALPVDAAHGFVQGPNILFVKVLDAAGGQVSNIQINITVGSPPPASGGSGASSTNTSCAPGSNNCLYNPLPEGELTHVFLVIMKGLLGIVGIWAVIFIVLGGFQMVTSAGNEEGIAKAKKTITWAVIGLVVALLSFSIIAIVQNLLQANVQ